MRKFYDAQATSGGYSANDSIPTAKEVINNLEWDIEVEGGGYTVISPESAIKAMIEFAKLYAVGFMNWRNNVRNFDKNIIRNNPDITTEQLYEEYLKTSV